VISIAGGPIAEIIGYWDMIQDCLLHQQWDGCTQDLVGLLPLLDQIMTIKGCVCGISANCGSHTTAGRAVAEQCDRLDKLVEAVVAFFGREAWLRISGEDQALFTPLWNDFVAGTAPASEAGAKLSAAELAGMLSHALPPPVTTNDVEALVGRWNRTMDYWAGGITNASQVPIGQSTDFIGMDVLQSAWAVAQYGLQANVQAGYPNLYDAAAVAVAALRAEEAPSQGACARVSLRINQSAVMTRSAFAGLLELNNNSASPLLNVGVTLDIRDASGRPAMDLFGTNLMEWSGFMGFNGSATLPGLSTGFSLWRIVPSPEAATDGPTVYFIGGTLSYLQDGRLVRVTLYPQRVVVWPQAQLAVHYFLPREVYGDDPFTPEIEPVEPFSLGLLVNNQGGGPARDLAITTSQPQIVDNERNLLVDFQILGSQVGDQPGSPCLTVQLGDILPGSNAVATWQMTASLSGRFAGWEATYEHLDSLGRPNLSLVSSVTTHDLIHVVRAANPGSDQVPDFLVDEVVDIGGLPDTLYLSDGTRAPVAAVTNAVVTAVEGTSNRVVVASLPSGWSYLRIPDPAPAGCRLSRVVRTNDNVEVVLGYNAWTTHRIVRPLGGSAHREDFLHLLDYDSSGVYQLVYEPIPADTNAPTSSVAVLPAESFELIPLSWSGEDNADGSGLAWFDIYASVNDGPFTLWLGQTTLRSAVYVGQLGSHYAFYSRATDVAGNREAAPGTPDAQTTVSLTNTAPVLVCVTNVTIDENQVLSVACVASDAESPPQVLTYSLAPGAPKGMVIDAQSGVITWATGEAHGDSVNPVTVIVSDNGIPPLSDSCSFTVLVKDVNSAPVLAPQPVVAVSVGELLRLTNSALDPDIPAQTLTFSLGQISATNALIDETNGVFRWVPSVEHASTTNYFEVIVTDNGLPSLSATQLLTVIVNDYLAFGAGSTVVPILAEGAVDLGLYSSAGVSEITGRICFPAGYLTNVSFSPILGNLTWIPVTPECYDLRITAPAGHPFLGSGSVAWMSFTTLSNQSAFVPLVVSELGALKPNGEGIPKIAPRNGRVVVVGTEPLLEAWRDAHAQPMLTLYGTPGQDYWLEWKTNLSDTVWPDNLRVSLTDLSQSFTVPTNVPSLFYRAKKVTP